MTVSSERTTDGTSRWSNPHQESNSLIGQGAVLYDVREPDRRPCCREGGRCLAHVVGVYEETETDEVYFRVQDGTHTTENWCHQDDLLALYEPAGWSVNTAVKPTYVLTRGHGVEDHHDRMTVSGRMESTEGVPRSRLTTAHRDTCWLLKCDRPATEWIYSGDDFAAEVCEPCHKQLTDSVHWEDGNGII